MNLEAGLNRLKECYLFAHLTYCVLSVTCLIEWMKATKTQQTENYLLLWLISMLVILSLIPAQHKIITKTYYGDNQGMIFYKATYATVICLAYTPVVVGIFGKSDLSILIIVPVILNSIICGTVYGLITSVVIIVADLISNHNPSVFSPAILTDHVLTLALLATTAWFVGQSFEYIKNLFYQLVESERQQKNILQNLGVATLYVNSSGMIIKENSCFRDLVGGTSWENTSLQDVITKHLPLLEAFTDQRLGLPPRGVPMFGQAISSGGQTIPVQCISYPANSGLGTNTDDTVICISDISISEKLEEEKIRTNFFIDLFGPGLILTDGSGEIIELNRQAELMLGVSKHTALNQNLKDFLVRIVGAKASPQMINSPSFELELQGCTLLVNCTDLRRSTDKIIGSICIINDITEQKEMERKMHRSATLSAIGELAAGTAHEIRNPLTSIRGFLQLMMEKQDAPVKNFNSYFDVMLTEVDRINTIVTEFLKLAKPDKVALHKVELNNILQSIWQLLQSEALLREVRLEFKPGVSTTAIMGNVDMLKQIIINLVNNAMQATGREGVVKVATSRQANSVILTVEDNGPGIDESVLPRIFDPFFTTRDEGTGLGLAITNKIVSDHNALIEVESQLHEGTTFYIKFPAIEDNISL